MSLVTFLYGPCLIFYISDGLKTETKASLAGKGKKGRKKEMNEPAPNTTDSEAIVVTMHFKRYVYDPSKKMKQT